MYIFFLNKKYQIVKSPILKSLLYGFSDYFSQTSDLVRCRHELLLIRFWSKSPDKWCCYSAFFTSFAIAFSQKLMCGI